MHVSPARGRPHVPVGGAGFPFSLSYNILFLSSLLECGSSQLWRNPKDFFNDVRALCILFCLCDPVTTEPELSQLAAGAEIWLAVRACRAPRLDPGAVTYPSVCNWGWCGGEGEPRVSRGKARFYCLSGRVKDGGKRGGGAERDGRR